VSRRAKVTGLDFSSAMIAEASALHPDISCREGDAGELPFADASFDVVVSRSSCPRLHCSPARTNPEGKASPESRPSRDAAQKLFARRGAVPG